MNVPIATPISLPTTTTTVSTSTAGRFCQTSRGSISMPTETKNTAANTTRPGPIRCSMTFAAPDSATGARRDRGQHREQQDRDQVLDDQDAEDDLGQPALDLLLGERLHDDRGARD